MENKTVMSSSSTLENMLENATVYVTIVGGIFLFVAGNIGCMGNILVFRSQTYRRQACFIYLFWGTIASLFILNCILLTRILESGFNVSLMDISNVFCRIREFISMVMYQSENTMFLFATLDRILSAQRSNKLRLWSNRVPLAYKLVVANFVLWIAVSTHRLVLYTNVHRSCEAEEGFYRVFDTYLDMALTAVGAPLLVIVLTALLWHTIRSVSQRHAALQNQGINEEIDSQLSIMLFTQSVLAVINYVPYGIYILYALFTDGWIKSTLRIA
ncbi:unnamed protein product [Adineta ricciae]|uniref:G-protein coupled receptors family 1 profile domain-containing protein n=1 Tax=Adineta ricciae TaxID=249248 RepID=A0A815JE11_ADIRI|nr:unnamed protein product [Adineta ricciae]CAF1380811.1 unnamed protein product [Adineta ricciae]